MAKAQGKLISVPIVTPAYRIEREYTLTLSQDEAQTLYDIFHVIAGDRTESRRRHTEAISDALQLVGGLEWQFSPLARPQIKADLTGSIGFLATK